MNTTFNAFRITALLLPAAIIAAAPQPEPPADDETYQGEAPERYAMVRALEGEVRVLKGELDEALTRGTPISEGDVVESRGRGVLQLGDGTRIAFGGATRFSVLALFTDRKGEKQVLLRLDHGRLRVLLGGQSDARLRVDTPSGTATCLDKGAFTLEAERDRLVRLKVHSGRVTFANEREEARLSAGERLTVYSAQDGLDRVRSFNTFDGDEFDRWSERAMAIRRGESWERVPTELRYYADDLDSHGRWVNSDEFGWVWQPSGVAEDWRPYYRGRWAPYAGGMTWISDEPWAYVAYHHGRWHWGAGVGWFWIPGVYYSPAWVAWNNTPGYCGWAPLGYYNTPCHWGYGAWGGGYAWNVVAVGHINLVNVHLHLHSDPIILRGFNGGPAGGRDLRAPWQRSPLIVSHAEFRNPAQIQTAFRRDVHRERLVAYEHQAQAATGRGIIRRELRQPAPPDARSGSALPGPVRKPFEDRGHTRPIETFVPKERTPENRPQLDRGRDLLPERKGEGAVRTPEPRVERRLEQPPLSRERAPEPRLERKPEPTPVPRERVPEGRTERRIEPTPAPRERVPEPRLERRSEEQAGPRERLMEARPRVDREERRPQTPARPVEREARPAPKAEAPKAEVAKEHPKERPKEEKR